MTVHRAQNCIFFEQKDRTKTLAEFPDHILNERFRHAVATMKMPANSQIVSHISHKNLCFRYLQLLRRTGHNRELSKLSDLAWNSLHKFTCTDLNIPEFAFEHPGICVRRLLYYIIIFNEESFVTYDVIFTKVLHIGTIINTNNHAIIKI